MMTLHYTDDRVTLYHGDCRDIMEGQLPDNSVDSIVTDPPYELGFMGKGWDGSGIAYNCEVWENAYRVLKPGGHLLAFGGTRTWHRLAVAIEDAGFEVRDSIAWMYGSGFPKSHDVSKGIDKRRNEDKQPRVAVTSWVVDQCERRGWTRAMLCQEFGVKNQPIQSWTERNANYAVIPTWENWLRLKSVVGFDDSMDAEVWRLNGRKGTPGEAWAEREVVGTRLINGEHGTAGGYANGIASHNFDITITRNIDITAPATPAAQQWQGWGTALKPAHEPIVVARKPLIGTVAANVLTHGTGALNIDGCRIGTEQTTTTIKDLSQAHGNKFGVGGIDYPKIGEKLNPPGRWPANVILDESQAAALDAQSGWSESKPSSPTASGPEDIYGAGLGNWTGSTRSDSGGASRFFYVAKAGKKERPNLNGVAHPTVKPMALMQYLVRLVTPPGGTVLEPFAGSGTTIEAALNEGFNVIGIEMTDEYLPLIMARIERYGDKLC
jgi:hypothetical protein